MGKTLEALTPELTEWIEKQRMFFVATAPLSGEGHVNLSPKGQDSLRVLGPTQVAYHDFVGSGVETIAHLAENGRIVLMFCAFEGPPRILRLHGRGRVLHRGTEAFDALRGSFPDYQATRAIIRVDVTRVATSCGYGVPRLRFESERQQMFAWAEKKGPEGIQEYQRRKNRLSIDGLPALPTGDS